MRPFAMPLFLLPLLAACVSSHAERLGEALHPPRSADAPVAIYHALQDVPRAFTKVALLLADGSSEASWERVFAALRAQARAAGADAVVLQGVGSGAGIDGEACCGDKLVWALAIRFDSGDP
jgi:nucleotide-binding universal stress UspA family protein